MPTFPVDQEVATTASAPSIVVNPLARPFSQSITAFGASCSGSEPTVTQPWERPVPGASECTTAKPRGTHVATSEVETFSRVGLNTMAACDVRGGGASPTSCFTSHRNWRLPDVPAKYGEDSYRTGTFKPSVSVWRGRVTSTNIRSRLPSPSESNSVSTKSVCRIQSA